MEAPRNARPPRAQRLQSWIDQHLTMCILAVMEQIPHASMDPDPRPMENVSLFDMRETLEAGMGANRSICPDAFWWLFYSNRYKVPLDKGMRVAPDHLWWLIQPGDIVLLSDKVTHHYTRIGKVDRDTNLVAFLDLWPEDFFLQAGRNVLGIVSSNCTINREEFAEVIVGVVTWDTPELLELYFDAFPDSVDAERLYRAGQSIMAIGPERICSLAVKFFLDAMLLAEKAGDETFGLQSAARAWLANMCAFAFAQKANIANAVEMQVRLLEIWPWRASTAVLLRRLNKFELARLANAAVQVGGFEMVEEATALAIEQDPEFGDSYWLRAIARRITDPAAGVDDARRALSLNTREISKLEAEIERLGSRQVIGPTDLKLAERKHRRITILETLAAAAALNGDYMTARDACYQLLNLNPDRLDVLPKLLVLEQSLNNREGVASIANALLNLPASEEIHVQARQALEDLGKT